MRRSTRKRGRRRRPPLAGGFLAEAFSASLRTVSFGPHFSRSVANARPSRDAFAAAAAFTRLSAASATLSSIETVPPEPRFSLGLSRSRAEAARRFPFSVASSSSSAPRSSSARPRSSSTNMIFSTGAS